MRRLGARILYTALALALAGGVAWLLRPTPIGVAVAPVARGPLEVTVNEDGAVRSRDRFVVAAPVAGRLMRITLRDGDPVTEGEVVARIAPTPLSSREREEQLARVAAAEALHREAEERVRHAQEDYAQARRERERMDRLYQAGFVAAQDAEQARVAETTSANEAAAARARAESAASDARAARAALMSIEQDGGRPRGLVEVRVPTRGKILRVHETSERVVSAGTPLLTVSDVTRLEVVLDVLSTDAVKVRPGMPVAIENWGGGRELRARVRTVEPFAFTKVSALGVEEQRANIVADFVDRPDGLGDGYRVEGRIVIWSAPNVVKVPASALFRRGESWQVFVVDQGRARLRTVQIGQRSETEAEVVRGLEPGALVIRHPGNELRDGARVRPDPT